MTLFSISNLSHNLKYALSAVENLKFSTRVIAVNCSDMEEVMKLLHHKNSIGIAAIAAVLLLAGGLYYAKTRPVVLEFGMFTGSNWNVANANSFVIIDKIGRAHV